MRWPDNDPIENLGPFRMSGFWIDDIINPNPPAILMPPRRPVWSGTDRRSVWNPAPEEFGVKSA